MKGYRPSTVETSTKSKTPQVLELGFIDLEKSCGCDNHLERGEKCKCKKE